MAAAAAADAAAAAAAAVAVAVALAVAVAVAVRSHQKQLEAITSKTPDRVPCVGGSSMHMKWPDGIGREAGIGRTRNGKELSVFRARPW